jgi:hypothetical protein
MDERLACCSSRACAFVPCVFIATEYRGNPMHPESRALPESVKFWFAKRNIFQITRQRFFSGLDLARFF